jgi:hypothetical protein
MRHQPLVPRRGAGVVVHVPEADAASLLARLGCAAVVAHVSRAGVVIPRRTNRVFSRDQIIGLVHEWMQERPTEVVLATIDATLVAIVLPAAGPTRRTPAAASTIEGEEWK